MEYWSLWRLPGPIGLYRLSLTRLSHNSVEIEVNFLNTDSKQIFPVHKNVKFDYYSGDIDQVCQFYIHL